MATQRGTVDFILSKLRNRERFSIRSMFGEYALYADGKTVAFVCDDLLYVKIVPASQALEPLYEKGPPYPGAKFYYIVDEGQLSTVENFSDVLFSIAESIPAKKKPKKGGYQAVRGLVAIEDSGNGKYNCKCIIINYL